MDGRLDVEAEVGEEAGQIGWEGGRGEVERGVVSVCSGHLVGISPPERIFLLIRFLLFATGDQNLSSSLLFTSFSTMKLAFRIQVVRRKEGRCVLGGGRLTGQGGMEGGKEEGGEG